MCKGCTRCSPTACSRSIASKEMTVTRTVEARVVTALPTSQKDVSQGLSRVDSDLQLCTACVGFHGNTIRWVGVGSHFQKEYEGTSRPSHNPLKPKPSCSPAPEGCKLLEVQGALLPLGFSFGCWLGSRAFDLSLRSISSTWLLKPPEHEMCHPRKLFCTFAGPQ